MRAAGRQVCGGRAATARRPTRERRAEAGGSGRAPRKGRGVVRERYIRHKTQGRGGEKRGGWRKSRGGGKELEVAGGAMLGGVRDTGARARASAK